jgi:hypothetical protein
VAAAGLALGLLAAGGCTSADRPGEGTPTGDFTGPWAAELAYFDSMTDSAFAHRALADSRLSDSEVTEGRALVEQCYVDHGAEVRYDAYGRATVTVVTGPEDPMDVMGTCEFADGGVVVLAGQIRLNPDNLDALAIQAACMVEHAIVEPGFTGRDLEHYLQQESAAEPWEPSDQDTATTCQIDPLGLAGGPAPNRSATP